MVLVGDHRQLQAIGPGGLFHELFLRARPEQKAALTEIVRQRESWAREAVKQIGRGEPAKALRAYEKAGRLTVSPTRDDAERKLIERWREGGVTNPQDNLILASTNAEVSRLNRHAQELGREAGQLGLRSLRVGEEQIHEGDRVLFTETMKARSREGRFRHGDPAGPATRKLTVQIDGQEKPVTFSLEKFDALRLGYAATTHRSQAMTVENTFVLFGGGMQSREMSYVQISRARGECHLFADRQSAPTFSDLEPWCVAPTRNSRLTRLTAKRITAGRSDATSSRKRSSSPCNRPVKIEASTPGGDGNVHHESAGRSEDPRSRSAHGEALSVPDPGVPQGRGMARLRPRVLPGASRGARRFVAKRAPSRPGG